MANLKTRAKRNAKLRYAGEERALGALMQQAETDYKTDRNIANTVARAGVRGAKIARPPLKKVYHQAAAAADTAKADVDTAFAGLGAGADPYRAVTDREMALNRQHTTDARARTLAENTDRATEARVGRVFALGAAKQSHNTAIAQLLNQARALRGEKGEFTLAQLDELRDASKATREQRRRDKATQQTQIDVATIGQGIDPKTGKPIPGGKADKSAEKAFEPATRESLRLFKTDYRRALDWAQGLSKNNSREQVRKALTKGMTVKDEDGKVTATIPQIDDQLALRAALDFVYADAFKPGTVNELHKYGVRADALPKPKDQTVSARNRRKAARTPILGGLLEQALKPR